MTTTSALRGAHPRPQLVRPDRWWSLDGTWAFTFDDDQAGLRERWHAPAEADRFGAEIRVPFPPESIASGIADHGDHAALWYRRTLPALADLTDLGSDRLLLHLGAVDHECDVWVDGAHAVRHEGGQTPFTADITDLLDPALPAGAHVVVVRATDDRTDVEQPRGKQDWQPEQHAIWYDRTSGIWRTVWLERVPAVAVDSLVWRADVPGARMAVQVRLRAVAPQGVRVRVRLSHDGIEVGTAEVPVAGSVADVVVPLPQQHNGQAYERLLWSPDSPVLLDAEVVLSDAAGAVLDRVDSYCGLRSVAVAGDTLLLNDRPFTVRAVLEQGYWPDSHLTPPGPDALREEVQLALDLGFNTVRVHQKVEDPRYLYWCDVLGLAVWAETAGAYRFSDEAVAQLTREWLDIVRRDVSHPCIIAWVPFNESWGVQHLAHDPAQQAYSRALTELTRALDPTRPVISNDGWEHTASDLLTVHDYADTGAVLRERYGDRAAVARTLDGIGPAGRRMWVGGPAPEPGSIPVLLSEFGGVSFAPGAPEGAWGYSEARTPEDLEARLTDLLGAVRSSTALSGFCYTQLTDTGLETNGLCTADRKPKLPVEALRRIIAG
ncbi:glycoside hydrolase family 2 protein [Cellulomonas denverensis]|uniref:Glycoside hydrolase family 2 n=1 Tax=Cellulomonas denverensis TaxID=264297 RepID=A0A7X6QXV8_9CELL|nr:glycoside hydrolase family 2 TIM barrel-domain containing protein [Cellulomonas denverensis]NKY21475.1 glycoside hydrolase family 2 [Cellulomonas denverensis]GIG26987.1 beta-galactosidase [Cellulomonas denverensis]